MDTKEFVAEAQPAVKGHRYAPLIEIFAMDQQREPDAVRQRVEAMTYKDLKLKPYRELKHVPYSNNPPNERLERAWQQAWTNGDMTALGLADLVEYLTKRESDRREMTELLGQASPFNPLTAAARIDLADPTKFKVEDYAAQAEFQPLVQSSLGKYFYRVHDWKQARLWLDRFIKASPDYWAFTMLADTYLQEGDEAKWLEVEESSLNQPDPGLSHAWMNQEISRHFMKTGRFAKALPYAEAAAQSWAGWAMDTARQCNEGLGKWAEAETWARNIAERYDDAERWFDWCVRTGHGDLAAARLLMEATLQNVAPGKGNARDFARRAYLALVAGDKASALNDYEAAFKKESDPGYGIDAALLAAESGDTVRRDALIADALRRGAEYKLPDYQHRGGVRTEMLALGKLFQDIWGGRAKADPAAWDKVIATASPGEDVNLWCLTGRFLAIQGDAEGAKKYFAKCVTLSGPRKRRYALAYHWLREMGVEPMDLQMAMIKQLVETTKPATRPAE